MTPESFDTTAQADAAASASSRGRAILRDLADALRGTAMDYTQGNLWRAILLLSVPMMLMR